MAFSPQVPLTTADHARRRGLRLMRSVAVGLLLFAAVVYLLTRGGEGFWGYVNSGAEASMVGAIADWFAVTALFRHPLGLPIPHTALIPRRKDDLARGLQEFVTENFLQADIVRARILTATISHRVATWLMAPANAARVANEVAAGLDKALERVDSAAISGLLTQVVIPRLSDEPVAPLAGNLLDQVLQDNAHHGLVDLVLDEAAVWLSENYTLFTEVLAERAPAWAPELLNRLVTDRAFQEVVAWVDEIRDNPHHRARVALDSLLGRLAHDLQHDRPTQARTEAWKQRLLTHPQLEATTVGIVKAAVRALRSALADPAGPVHDRIATELIAIATQVQSDPQLQARIDATIADAGVYAVSRYGRELTTVITDTIQAWDGKEAASRIELHVGRDLQFIRINGTIVGGLVGVAIHALSQIVP